MQLLLEALCINRFNPVKNEALSLGTEKHNRLDTDSARIFPALFVDHRPIVKTLIEHRGYCPDYAPEKIFSQGGMENACPAGAS